MSLYIIKLLKINQNYVCVSFSMALYKTVKWNTVGMEEAILTDQIDINVKGQNYLKIRVFILLLRIL